MQQELAKSTINIDNNHAEPALALVHAWENADDQLLISPIANLLSAPKWQEMKAEFLQSLDGFELDMMAARLYMAGQISETLPTASQLHEC